MGGALLASFLPPLIMKVGMAAVIPSVAIESCSGRQLLSLRTVLKDQTNPMRANLAAHNVVGSNANHLEDLYALVRVVRGAKAVSEGQSSSRSMKSGAVCASFCAKI